MATQIHDTPIHSIQIGSLESPLRFTVNQVMTIEGKSVTISNIVCNENYLADGYKDPIYEIYAKDGQREFLFKYFSGHPVYVSCKF